MRPWAFLILIAGPMVAACGLNVVGIDRAADAGVDAGPSGTTPSTDSTPIIDAGGVPEAERDAALILQASTSVIPSRQPYNLSDLGTLDWAFFGAASPVRKADAGLIHGYTASADAGFLVYPGADVASWSDGTSPNQTGASSSLAAFLNPPADLTFTIPAATTTETFSLFIGGNGSSMSIDANLDGQTASTTINADKNTTTQYGIAYALKFAAPTPQTLTVTMHLIACGNGTCGANNYFVLGAATLATP